MTKPSPQTETVAAQNFFDSLKDDPKAIIKWCRREIKAYEELIALLEKQV